jgi:hypothetical protein
MAKISEIVAALLLVKEEEGNLEVVVVKEKEFRAPTLESAFVELCDIRGKTTARVVIIKEL